MFGRRSNTNVAISWPEALLRRHNLPRGTPVTAGGNAGYELPTSYREAIKS